MEAAAKKNKVGGAKEIKEKRVFNRRKMRRDDTSR